MHAPRLSPGWIAVLYGVLTTVYSLVVHELADGLDVVSDVVFVALTSVALFVLVRGLNRRAERERDLAVGQAVAATTATRMLRLAVGLEQALIRATTDKEVFDGLCRAVVADPRFALAWVGRAEPAPERRITVVAAAGRSVDYVAGIAVTWDDAPSGAGPTGTAIRTGVTQVSIDIERDERLAPWRNRLLQRGFRSSIALPLKRDGATYGALSVYASEAGVFDPVAVAELERIALDAGFQLSALAARAARDVAIAAELARERELVAISRRFELLVEQAPVAIVVTDEAGAVVSWNPAAEAMSGWSEAEVVGGIPPVASADPSTGTEAPAQPGHAAILATGQLRAAGTRWRRRDGSVLTVDVVARGFTDEAGNRRILAMARDTTEEARGRARLALVHAIDTAILRGDRVAEIAPAVMEQLRVAVGADWAALSVTGDQPGVAVIIAASDVDPVRANVIGWRPVMTADGAARTTPLVADLAELALEFPDLASLGPRGMVRGMLLPLVHEDRMHGALALLSTDPQFPDAEAMAAASEVADQLAIALRHEEMRDDLAEREARLRAILDGSPNPILTARSDGRITYASPATARVFGGPVEQIVGRQLGELVPDDERERHADNIRSWVGLARDAESPHPLDVSGRRLDGTLVPLQVLLAPLVTTEGPAAIVTLVDLTERLALESRLRRAERLEILGQFAGILAHDVRNFFSAIAWSAEFLASDMEATDPRLADVRLILGAVKDGVTMTQSILEFARPAHDASGVVHVPAHLERTAGVLRRLLPNEIEVAVTCAPDVTHATISAEALSQVLLNLATNARDAMPAGGRLAIDVDTLELLPGERTTAALDPGPYVRIRVSDTGTGMDEATAARAFEAFFTTKTDGTTASGTGLGLASVYLILSRAGGQVDLETSPGTGATFTILLPVAVG